MSWKAPGMHAMRSERLPWQFAALGVAALLAASPACLAVVGMAESGQSLVLLMYGVVAGVPALAAWMLVLGGRGSWVVGYAVASAGVSLALVLLGLLTFGPLFAPALVFWSAASVFGVRAQRPGAMAVASTALWGIGLTMVLITLAAIVAAPWTR